MRLIGCGTNLQVGQEDTMQMIETTVSLPRNQVHGLWYGCHGKFTQSHLDNNLHVGVVRDKHTLESLVSHLAHATKGFPLEKALFLNALFATKP